MQHGIYLAVSMPTCSCLCRVEQENAEELAAASKEHQNKITSAAKQQQKKNAAKLKQHKKKQAATLKQHHRKLISKNRQHRREQAAASELHDKEVAVLTNALKISNDGSEHNEKEALHFQEKARRLKREKDAALDDMKVRHRAAIKHQQQVHATQIQKKKNMLKELDNLLADLRTMFSEFLDELTLHKKEKGVATRNNKRLKQKAQSAAKRIETLNEDITSLKDGIVFEEANVVDLEEKVIEYEQVIDAMQTQMDDANDEYENVIAYMEYYYEEQVATLSPRYITKHWVKNNGKRGEFTSF